MLPLMEMLSRGANGEMIDQIARQYDLSREQTMRAMEALMPAFSEGLKRNAGDPFGVMQFLNALSSGQHASYYDDPARAFGAAGVADGNAILGHLFGSREVSRAVAAQAAQMTGLSQSILKSMLPALAPIILGGLYKQMSGAAGETQARSAGDPLGPLGQIFGQMMGAGQGSANPWGRMFEQMMGGARQRADAPRGDANPWGDILEQMMGGRRDTGGRPAEPASDNPLGRIFEEMLKGATGPAQGRREPVEPRPEAPEPPERSAPRGGYEDLFGDMFETGRKMQKDYQKNVESIFDQYLEGMRKRP